MEAKKKRRSRLPRSKSGCRTCRIRHVKCDEAPGSCERCTKFGFKCDGYDLERRPEKRSIISRSAGGLTAYTMRLLLPGHTSDERRSFDYFYSFTTPMMNGWFDHRVWNGVVMQMSHAELAICHAAVAIGALQEALSELSEDTDSRMQRFAIYQHSRSIELLRSRMSSNDPNVKRTVLICCVLFIVFEIIHGNYDQAVMHLQNGLHILGTKKLRYQALYQEYPTFESNVENSLVAIMLHLDLQSAAFGWPNMHEQLDIAILAEEGSHWPGEVQFRSVQDAWIMRDRIFLQFCMFSRLCEPLSAAEVAANYAVLSKEQKKQQIQLLMFLQALDRLENTALWQGSLTERDRSAIELLRMHHAGISVITDICLIKSSEKNWNRIRGAFCSSHRSGRTYYGKSSGKSSGKRRLHSNSNPSHGDRCRQSHVFCH